MSISPDPVDHADLVSRLAQGDPAAEGLLIEHFTPRIRAMMMARTRDGDLARDLTQDTLIALLQALRQGQLREHDRLPAFAHGIAARVRSITAESSTGRARPPTQNSSSSSASAVWMVKGRLSRSRAFGEFVMTHA